MSQKREGSGGECAVPPLSSQLGKQRNAPFVTLGDFSPQKFLYSTQLVEKWKWKESR